ncbi:MAG: sigma-70 family RNA polymerase sigma factor [Bacteroidetes bacterium]|nr:sigma-70 family RNA polymerase sigma factor [Bacteroidota bacterium]
MNIFFGKNTDKFILDGIKTSGGRNKAISEVYRRYYDLMRSVVLRNSGSVEDAEDVIQEAVLVFVRMVQKDEFRGESAIGTFLSSVVRNIWLGKMRKSQAEQIRISKVEMEESEYVDHFSRAESYKTMQEVFEQLGETCRRLLTMFYYEEMNYEDLMPHFEFETEQALRNKKSKCMKGLSDIIERKPTLAKTLREALKI